MPYEPFYERFRDLALRETRSFTVADGSYPGLPADECALLEIYCNDENCDCRRVFFNVVSRKWEKIVAVVTYGWENEAFYRKWYGGKDDNLARMVISEMMGLGLNSISPQSEIAPALLAPIRDILLGDPAYIERLKRHYQIFKEKVDPKHFRKTKAATHVVTEKPKQKKRKRN
jgi:hypothetical protein